jgi:hypothetical protein
MNSFILFFSFVLIHDDITFDINQISLNEQEFRFVAFNACSVLRLPKIINNSRSNSNRKSKGISNQFQVYILKTFQVLVHLRDFIKNILTLLCRKNKCLLKFLSLNCIASKLFCYIFLYLHILSHYVIQ